MCEILCVLIYSSYFVSNTSAELYVSFVAVIKTGVFVYAPRTPASGSDAENISVSLFLVGVLSATFVNMSGIDLP